MDQNESLAKASLDFALTNVGRKEATGKNDGAFVNSIQEWYAGAREHGAPWCALFATWCIYRAAAILAITPKIPKTDSSTHLYDYAKKSGMLLEAPIAGCIGLVKGDGGSAGKSHHHTFRVTSVDKLVGVVHSCDGNWGNSVALTQHRIQDCDFMVVG